MWSLYFSMDTGINGHTTAPPTGIYQEMIHYRRVPRSFAGAQDDGCPAGIPDPDPDPDLGPGPKGRQPSRQRRIPIIYFQDKYSCCH